MRLLTTALVLALSTAAAHADYPEKPIELVVPWGAGGGTDAVARVIAKGLEDRLGVTVNVVNRTGGAGVVGHEAVVSAAPDGYTIGLATIELTIFNWLGNAAFTYEDVTPLALANIDAASFTVRSTLEWPDLKTALADIAEKPAGTYTFSSISGTGNHLAVASLLLAEGIDPQRLGLLPHPNSAAGLLELAAGGVDITPFSLPETAPVIEAGHARTLAVFSEERLERFADIPTAKEASGHAVVGGTWRAFVAPKGLPDDVRDTLTGALHQVWQSEEFRTFANERAFGLVWLQGEEFREFLKTQHESNGETLKAVGLID